jgi:hypothetical protein
MRRVYVPLTMVELARAHTTGELPGPFAAHAVTGAVREWYTEGDLEELEYVALTEAAEASLRRVAADPDAPRRRVVVAAEVTAAAVTEVDDPRFRAAVRIDASIAVPAVASVHVDEDDAAKVVAEAIIALAAADAGDEDARFVLDEAEATELLWYDVTEIGDLI